MELNYFQGKIDPVSFSINTEARSKAVGAEGGIEIGLT